jgi:chemotaxis family two-component system sensor kinase Cph1
LERFTYTVSHDLKSPLITINTFAGMILQSLQAGDHTNIPEDLGRISAAATKMGKLLDDLLHLSRIGRMIDESSRIDMNALVKDTLSMLEGTIIQRQVEIVVQAGLPEIYGDRHRIGIVLQNMIENAVKYMGNQANPRIEVGACRKGSETVFFVNENGIGIDPRQHDTIFDLFKKLDAKSQGTGIGLALAKRIIDLHGGRIWVESKGIGHGSSFFFTLPEAFK